MYANRAPNRLNSLFIQNSSGLESPLIKGGTTTTIMYWLNEVEIWNRDLELEG